MSSPGGPAGAQAAVATFGQRLGAFVVDSVISVVISLATGFRPGTGAYQVSVAVAFLAIELVCISAFGQTPGMRVLSLAVARSTDGGRPRVWWVALRTLLVTLVVPALFSDASGRWMHDRAAGTVTVSLRPPAPSRT